MKTKNNNEGKKELSLKEILDAQKKKGVSWTKRQLEILLKKYPKDKVVQYWLGVLHWEYLKNKNTAKKLFAKILKTERIQKMCRDGYDLGLTYARETFSGAKEILLQREII